MSSDQGSLFGKMSQEFCRRTITLSAASWRGLSELMRPSHRQQDGKVRVWFLDPSEQQRGVSWMPNISAWPNDAHVCSLSSVLETAPIPQKYYLSSKACEGILRRAERRGKVLPPALASVLEMVASQTSRLLSTSEQRTAQEETRGGAIIVSPTLNAGGHSRNPIDEPLVPWMHQGMRVQNPDGVADTVTHNPAGGTRINPVLAPCLTQNYGKQPDNSDTNAGPMLIATIFQESEYGVNEYDSAGAIRAGRIPEHQMVIEQNNAASTPALPSLRAHETPNYAIAFSAKDHGADAENDLSPTLRAGGHDKSHPNAGVMPAIAFTERGRDQGRTFESQEDLAYALCNPGSGGRTHSRQVFTPTMAVRRLTPLECERLQGFPDGYTAITHNRKPAADGPRYKALGNSMAVPVLAWIGERIRNR